MASPLKGFHIPANTKMPQTQADLAVYVKNLLAQMVSALCDMQRISITSVCIMVLDR